MWSSNLLNTPKRLASYAEPHGCLPGPRCSASGSKQHALGSWRHVSSSGSYSRAEAGSFQHGSLVEVHKSAAGRLICLTAAKRSSTNVHAGSVPQPTPSRSPKNSGTTPAPAPSGSHAQAQTPSIIPAQLLHLPLTDQTLRLCGEALRVKSSAADEQDRKLLGGLKKCIPAVVCQMQKEGKLDWSVDRNKLAGSRARNTATGTNADYDLVLFIQPVKPPKGNKPVKPSEWKDLLVRAGTDLPGVLDAAIQRLASTYPQGHAMQASPVASQGVRSSTQQLSLQCAVTDQWCHWAQLEILRPSAAAAGGEPLYVDILLAVNMLHQTPKTSGQNKPASSLGAGVAPSKPKTRPQMQADKVVKLIDALVNLGVHEHVLARFSPATCEALIAFRAGQPPLVASVVRTLKTFVQCQRSLHGHTKKISGMSFLLELLVVRSYYDILDEKQRSPVEAWLSLKSAAGVPGARWLLEDLNGFKQQRAAFIDNSIKAGYKRKEPKLPLRVLLVSALRYLSNFQVLSVGWDDVPTANKPKLSTTRKDKNGDPDGVRWQGKGPAVLDPTFPSNNVLQGLCKEPQDSQELVEFIAWNGMNVLLATQCQGKAIYIETPTTIADLFTVPLCQR